MTELYIGRWSDFPEVHNCQWPLKNLSCVLCILIIRLLFPWIFLRQDSPDSSQGRIYCRRSTSAMFRSSSPTQSVSYRLHQYELWPEELLAWSLLGIRFHIHYCWSLSRNCWPQMPLWPYGMDANTGHVRLTSELN